MKFNRLVGLVLLWRIIIIGIVLAAPAFVAQVPRSLPETLWRRGLPEWVWVFANFDGVHYVTIAKVGYLLNLQPFFPLYPFAIRLAHELLGLTRLMNGPIVAGQVVSTAAVFAALVWVRELLRLDKFDRLTSWVMAAILVYPTAFFYTAVYNDALFFLLACMSLWWARSRTWWLASVAAGLATLTRLNGLALIFCILTEYAKLDWRGRRWLSNIRIAFNHSAISRSGILWVAAIPVVFIGYLLYVQRWFGSWQWIFTSMHTWGQDKLTFPIQVFWRYAKILTYTQPHAFTYWVAAMELGFVLLYLLLLLWSVKKIRLSYWVFFAVSILIPMLTGTFQGMPRYGLHLYPMYLILGLGLQRLPRLVSVGLLLLSAAGQVVLVALFSRGWFVS